MKQIKHSSLRGGLRSRMSVFCLVGALFIGNAGWAADPVQTTAQVDARNLTAAGTVKSANGEVSGKVDARNGTAGVQGQSGTLSSSVDADLKNGTVATSVQSGENALATQVDAKQQQVNVQVKGESYSGEGKADLKNGTGEATVRSGDNSLATQVDAKQQQVNVQVKGESYSGEGKADLKNGTGEATVRSGDNSLATQVNAKDQTINAQFEGNNATANGSADLKNGTGKVDFQAGNTTGHADVDVKGQTVNADTHTEANLADGEFKAQNEFGTVQGQYSAGGEVNSKVAITKEQADVELNAKFGLAAELEAVSETLAAGDENLGASVQAKAKVEALIGAEGTIGLHIDKNGITLGAEAKAGAYISAQVEVNFEAHVFGISTQIRAYAEGTAGVLAQGKAQVHIGFDGKVTFQLGAGLCVGLGLTVGLEFTVDASQLLEKYGLKDISELIAWIDEFTKDPVGEIERLLKNALAEFIAQGLATVGDAIVEGAKQVVDGIGQAINRLNPWYQEPAPEDTAYLPDPVRVTEPPIDTHDQETSPDRPNQTDGKGPFERSEKYKEWSQ